MFHVSSKCIRQTGMTRTADTHLNCYKLSVGDPEQPVAIFVFLRMEDLSNQIEKRRDLEKQALDLLSQIR